MRNLKRSWLIVVPTILFLAIIVWIAILEISCLISYDKTYGCLNLGQFGYPKAIHTPSIVFCRCLVLFNYRVFVSN